jgi:hypothetical protein
MATSYRWTTARRACITVLSIAIALTFVSFASTAGAATGSGANRSHAVARASRLVPPSLALAARRSTQADRLLVTRAKALKHCLATHRGHTRKCRAAQSGVQQAGVQLAAARRSLARIAQHTAHASDANANAEAATQAPSLTVSGETLSWNRVANVNNYVLVRNVAGQPAQYSVLTGTSTTPAPVPGVTAEYSVRTTVNGAEWSSPQSVAYPSDAPRPNTQAAPVISVSGETITWSPIGGVSTYILASTAPGKATQYSVVSGDSIAPAAVPGQTVQFSIRTAVNGSAWSAEVSIAFPTAGSTGSGTEAPVSFSEPFVKGINANIAGWGSQAPQVASEVNSLGANWAREDLAWSEAEPQRGVFDWTSFESVIATARANGLTILPIVGYAPSWTTPDDATAYGEFVKAAVARFGPGTEANLQWWELWNEPYFSYAWSNKTPEPEAYARDAVAAAEAARSVAPSVKLLISADYEDSTQTGGSTPWETSWIDDMFAAEPNLGQWINGVAAHPYGDDPSQPLAEAGGWKDASGNWAFQRIDNIRAKFLAHGVNVPFWLTEAGWSTWESSEAAQAKNYADLITQVKARPWVRALFPFCLREFSAEPTNNQPGFGLLKYGSWQPKAAFTTLQEGFKTLS